MIVNVPHFNILYFAVLKKIWLNESLISVAAKSTILVIIWKDLWISHVLTQSINFINYYYNDKLVSINTALTLCTTYKSALTL